jgi:hypothetical protein
MWMHAQGGDGGSRGLSQGYGDGRGSSTGGWGVAAGCLLFLVFPLWMDQTLGDSKTGRIRGAILDGGLEIEAAVDAVWW